MTISRHLSTNCDVNFNPSVWNSLFGVSLLSLFRLTAVSSLACPSTKLSWAHACCCIRSSRGRRAWEGAKWRARASLQRSEASRQPVIEDCNTIHEERRQELQRYSSCCNNPKIQLSQPMCLTRPIGRVMGIKLRGFTGCGLIDHCS